MLVSDIEEPVVAAAARTPFESTRRVFVIESVDQMNDQAANRMLKTLEEPAAYVHLLLLTDRREDVLATIASRCQPVRFDPLPWGEIAGRLRAAGVPQERAAACARLAEGDAGLAAGLADEAGQALRDGARELVRAALRGDTASRPWLALLAGGRAAATAAAEESERRTAEEVELIPSRDRRRHEREAREARRRLERRVRTRTLDSALRLAELWLRDMLCLQEGAAELILAVDCGEQLREDARACPTGAPLQAIELTTAARLSLSLNVSEELALEALAYRLAALLAA